MKILLENSDIPGRILERLPDVTWDVGVVVRRRHGRLSAVVLSRGSSYPVEDVELVLPGEKPKPKKPTLAKAA